MRPLFLIIGLFMLLISSCAPKKALVSTGSNVRADRSSNASNDGKTERARETSPTNSTNNSPYNTAIKPGTSAIGWAYIERYKWIAVEEMEKHGIPASIKLAQGILESGNGTSRLATTANNHFGIKCTGDWGGGKTYHNDDEDNECFRVYEAPEESFRDHSQFLLRRRYEKLFTLNKNDYKSWAKGLNEAGYATNPRYAELLIDLIERYDLHQLDRLSKNDVRRPSSEAFARATSIEPAPSVSNSNNPTQNSQTQQNQQTQQTQQNQADDKSSIQKNPKGKMLIHEVKDGETAGSIATKYGLSIPEFKRAEIPGCKRRSTFVSVEIRGCWKRGQNVKSC